MQCLRFYIFMVAQSLYLVSININIPHKEPFWYITDLGISELSGGILICSINTRIYKEGILKSLVPAFE